MTKSETGSFYESPRDYEALFNPGLQDLPFYLAVASQAAGPVLDLGCGTGRLLWPLRQAGIQVEGLDASEPMLEACREEGHRQGLAAPLHRADWRRFQLGRQFAAVFLPFNGLQHLLTAQDLAQFFERLRAHLLPGGLFAFDLHLPQVALLARDPSERFGVEEGPTTADGQRVIAEQSRYDPLTQVWTQTWTLANGQGDTRELSLELRQFFPEELRALLQREGFQVTQRWAGFAQEALSTSSLRQVLLCRAGA
jgi:SAM-dependent methyltransferase